MKLITWNCQVGAFKSKARHVAPLLPDVLAVQEVENIDGELFFDGEYQPTFRDRVCDPLYPKRAIGVFSYTNTRIEAVDLVDPAYCFRRYEVHTGDLHFQLAAVWTAATLSKETSYRQAHEGFSRNVDWIRNRSTVVLGDFNGNASYTGTAWKELREIIEPFGLVSAYHHFFSEEFGKETRPTYFYQRKKSPAYHIDYCFIPKDWANRIVEVEIGSYEKWCQISDHVPLIVHLDMS